MRKRLLNEVSRQATRVMSLIRQFTFQKHLHSSGSSRKDRRFPSHLGSDFPKIKKKWCLVSAKRRRARTGLSKNAI